MKKVHILLVKGMEGGDKMNPVIVGEIIMVVGHVIAVVIKKT